MLGSVLITSPLRLVVHRSGILLPGEGGRGARRRSSDRVHGRHLAAAHLMRLHGPLLRDRLRLRHGRLRSVLRRVLLLGLLLLERVLLPVGVALKWVFFMSWMESQYE